MGENYIDSEEKELAYLKWIIIPFKKKAFTEKGKWAIQDLNL